MTHYLSPYTLSQRAQNKEMLLPMPKVKADNIMIGIHLALSVLCAGKGSKEMQDCLRVAVHMTYFLRDATPDPTDLARYYAAEAALVRCANRGNAGQSWSLLGDDASVLQEIVTLYDSLMSALPMFKLKQAWERMEKFTEDARPSPLPLRIIDM